MSGRESPPPSGAAAEEHGRLAEALRAARDGDGEAFRMLYRATQPRLLRYLHALAGADAEDVASEAWLRIARDIRSFTGDYDDFRGWAATIARHRAIDHRRREERRPSRAVPVDQLSDIAGDDDPAAEAVGSAGTRAAMELIARLPRDQAEAVLLRSVIGLDAAAAGRVLGKQAGAVRTAAHRGLRRLNTLLTQPLPGASGAAARTPPSPRREADAADSGVISRRSGVTSGRSGVTPNGTGVTPDGPVTVKETR